MIDARDLDPATRERLGLPPLKASDNVGRDERAIGRKRHRTGAGFEADLNLTHRQYELMRVGKIWPHSPPFLRIGGRWTPRAGGGPIDRTGHVRIEWHGPQCFGWPNGIVVPVAFDAKVIDGPVYKHSPKQRHQLVQLRAAHEAGVTAFLLVHCVPVDRVFALGIEDYEHDLLMGKGVRLYEHRRPEPAFPLLPSVTRGATKAIAGWDWIPLLADLPLPR